MSYRKSWLALALMVGFQSTAAWAQQLTPEQQKIQELEQKVEELDRRLQAAEARTEGAPAPKAVEAAAPPVLAPAPVAQSAPASQTGSQRPTNAGVAAGTIPAAETNSVGLVTVGPGGFGIQSGDGNFLLKIGADVQTDLRTFTGTGSSALLDQILLRRVRPTFSGTVYKYIDYFVRPDFGQGSVVIYDVYAQLNYIPHFAIRVGKFKPPVGLERLQSDDDTSFIERGLPTLLVPSRAIGFQIAGDIVNHRLGYQLGVFNPVPDNSLSDTSPSNGRDYVARVFAAPFQPNENVLRGLGFGIAAQGGSVDGVALPAYKTVGQNTFFNFASGVTSAGHRTTVAPQAFYYLGPFGLLAEDTVTEEEFQKATTRRDVAFRSWQVQASYILTGEKKSFGSPVPRHPFAPFDHGWGAWEIAARTGDFRVDQGLFAAGFASLSTSPSFAREWVAGVNWYLNRIFRISMDYGHTNFLGGAVNADRAAERVILARFQINFI
ncbi:MAG: porin [Bryobacteraceae bacterium]|jgi:phosphate-selective porin OprO/OprP